MKKYLLAVVVCLVAFDTFSQEKSLLKWWNPAEHAFSVIEGQAWAGETKAPYDRLPARAEGKVPPAVWNLSQHSAGLMVRFRSNSPQIVIRYISKPKGEGNNYGMDHMPATGVSGVDLYAITNEGREIWCAAKRNFGDTITYRYEGLRPNDQFHELGREYRIYLPLYNSVSWLEVGVETSAHFKPLPVRKEKPIVVYGTSIAHGACASRPGMAWTSILGRKMDRPLINLAFSGNGRLDSSVVDFVNEIDAKVFVLDCLPNLIPGTWERLGINGEQGLKDRVLTSVRALRAKHLTTPILLVDNAGYTDALVNDDRKWQYTTANRVQQEAFYQLKKEGVTSLFYLTKEEIGLGLDDMVDGTHPTDLGMLHYAQGYEKSLRAILNEPVGVASTTKPVTQYREPNNYDWEERHNEILQLNSAAPPNMVFLANSIIHFWGGLPRTKRVVEEESWKTLFTPAGMRNQAYGWDRVENVLWRVYHGELDGFEAKKIFIMIGTNNLHLNTDDEILEGLGLLLDAIKIRQPKAEVTLMGLLPRRNNEQRVADLNLEMARLSSTQHVKYADLGAIFLKKDNKIDESLFSDGLHPNAAGYVKMRDALKPLIEIPKEMKVKK
ncbi:SGNH/GDSL hydrolase family protein [uncultured Imperialibacter sp.]|uniref:SGNH/GDSL hydrolase family protein n=1 Tax=uncultured Imperialibacter sp. TaxID=1672639 RepID=UPI0030DD97F3|tara:strand:+ start:38970 stop:40796 length:1827 start_codon:yes stop_codon:yes gene_type:complete